MINTFKWQDLTTAGKVSGRNGYLVNGSSQQIAIIIKDDHEHYNVYDSITKAMRQMEYDTLDDLQEQAEKWAVSHWRMVYNKLDQVKEVFAQYDPCDDEE